LVKKKSDVPPTSSHLQVPAYRAQPLISFFHSHPHLHHNSWLQDNPLISPEQRTGRAVPPSQPAETPAKNAICFIINRLQTLPPPPCNSRPIGFPLPAAGPCFVTQNQPAMPLHWPSLSLTAKTTTTRAQTDDNNKATASSPRRAEPADHKPQTPSPQSRPPPEEGKNRKPKENRSETMRQNRKHCCLWFLVFCR